MKTLSLDPDEFSRTVRRAERGNEHEWNSLVAEKMAQDFRETQNGEWRIGDWGSRFAIQYTDCEVIFTSTIQHAEEHRDIKGTCSSRRRCVQNSHSAFK